MNEPTPPPDARSGARPLSDRARAVMRVRHLSPRTEDAYLGWMRRSHEFNGRKDPARFWSERVTAFLSHLATDLDVSPSTQNQALAALLFLYRDVLGIVLPWLDDVVRAMRSARLQTVSSREVRLVLSNLSGTPRLMATMLYGSGLRLLECRQIRVKDVDLDRRQVVVREGKGDKDRVTVLPARLRGAFEAQVAR
jgi:integrase